MFPLSFFPIFILVCSRLLFSVFLHLSSTAPSSLPFTPRLYETKTRLQNSSPVSPNLIFVGPSLSLNLSSSLSLSPPSSPIVLNIFSSEFWSFHPSTIFISFSYSMNSYLSIHSPLITTTIRIPAQKRTNQTYLEICFIKSWRQMMFLNEIVQFFFPN